MLNVYLIVLQECLSRFLARLSFYLAFFGLCFMCYTLSRIVMVDCAYEYTIILLYVCIVFIGTYIWNSLCFNVKVNVSHYIFHWYKKWLSWSIYWKIKKNEEKKYIYFVCAVFLHDLWHKCRLPVLYRNNKEIIAIYAIAFLMPLLCLII